MEAWPLLQLVHIASGIAARPETFGRPRSIGKPKWVLKESFEDLKILLQGTIFKRFYKDKEHCFFFQYEKYVKLSITITDLYIFHDMDINFCYVTYLFEKFFVTQLLQKFLKITEILN